MYKKCLKRIFDLFFSLILILVLLPIFIILSVLVRVKLGSPVLFSQNRIGKKEKGFRLYKFRTMTNETDKKGNPLPDEERITSFGKKLRSSSLDELPELFSILKGDMSFIGPRPLPVEYIPYFKEEERIIHTVKGGLIPPDCLSGKAVLSWEEQFEYEMEYAKNISFLNDIRILFSTIQILVKRVENEYGGEVRKSLIECRKDMCDGYRC